jgi:hypothetical protein
MLKCLMVQSLQRMLTDACMLGINLLIFYMLFGWFCAHCIRKIC